MILMEEDEEIKQNQDSDIDYNEYNIENLLKEIAELEKKISYLKSLVDEKKSGKKQANKLFKK